VLTTPLPCLLSARPAAACAPKPIPPLIEYLAAVPDPRRPQGTRHPLPAVLALVCCALLCGERYLQAIAEWGRNHSAELTRALGFTRPKTPCCATLHNLLSELDWAALERQLRAWAVVVEACLPPEPTADGAPRLWEAVAVDGKTLRGALKMEAEVAQLVSALGHRLGLTHAVGLVPAGDEIGAVEALLKQVVLAGRVVTLDALHTQEDTARLISEGGGHYLMLVKGNQPTLQEQVTTLFAPERAQDQDRESAATVEQGHGRIENRWLLAVSVTSAEVDWPGAAQAFVIQRRRWKCRQRQDHFEVVYGITSLTREEAGPAELLRLVRGHWRVENRSHWVRDVVFGEDASLVCTGKLPQVLALFRTAVISRLRAERVSNLARETRRLAAQPADCLRLLGLTEN